MKINKLKFNLFLAVCIGISYEFSSDTSNTIAAFLLTLMYFASRLNNVKKAPVNKTKSTDSKSDTYDFCNKYCKSCQKSLKESAALSCTDDIISESDSIPCFLRQINSSQCSTCLLSKEYCILFSEKF